MIHFVLGAVVALLHITPTVVLLKREDAVKRILPEATAFSARELHLSDPDAHKLHTVVDWSPSDDRLTFYTGRAADRTVGALVFLRVDSPHGPVEVAVGFSPAGAVRRVEVTKATVETKNWVLQALRAGLLDHYVGLVGEAEPAGAAALKPKVGPLPRYMASVVDKAVARAMASYRLFYRPSA